MDYCEKLYNERVDLILHKINNGSMSRPTGMHQIDLAKQEYLKCKVGTMINNLGQGIVVKRSSGCSSCRS